MNQDELGYSFVSYDAPRSCINEEAWIYIIVGNNLLCEMVEWYTKDMIESLGQASNINSRLCMNPADL